jgi:DNA-binding NarL/FixJ family response regulator
MGLFIFLEVLMRNITFRDRQYIAMLAMGLESPEIAKDLGVVRCSVDNAVADIMKKMDAQTRAEVVAKSFKEGYLAWNDGSLVINHDIEGL